ncbi:MAG: glycosyltransferase family 39 protein [Streptococcaceae bacterium]|jgi:hypothetical protein|nr:glycosyltransferase family 39 protein [Streptococcaceae bacterium]
MTNWLTHISKRSILLIAIAFVSILIYSKSSPLYFTNNWVDPNAYMTVGRGILHGLVPYRDLFEQKGPLLYFIHAIAALFGNNFFGVFLIEGVLMSANLLIFYQLAKLFLNEMAALFTTFFLPFLLVNYSWFQSGDSAEEFAVPAILYVIYLIFAKVGREISLSARDFYVLGLLTAYLFWIKYTTTGALIGFFLFVGIYLLLKRSWRELGIAVATSFMGMLTLTLPILLYFALNDALESLFNVYFVFNMTSYSGDTSFLGRMTNIWGVLTYYGSLHPLAFGLGTLGVVVVLIIATTGVSRLFHVNRLQNKHLANSLFLVCFVTTVIGQFYGGRAYGYYLFVLVPFAAFGMIGIGLIVSRWTSFTSLKKYYKISYSVSILLAILLPLSVNINIAYSRLNPNNTDRYDNVPGKPANATTESAQDEFAKIIDKVPNSTLLNYQWLDWGFYLAADKIPVTYYFEQQNVDYNVYPQNTDAQNQYVAEGLTTFVVCEQAPNVHSLLAEHYTMVASHTQTSEGGVNTYYLYELKTMENS